jgi:hypothetical protein
MKCEYPLPKKRISPVDHISPNAVASTPSSTEELTSFSPFTPANGPPQETSLNTDNVLYLRLMHHFCIVTAKTLSADPAGQELLQTHLVNVALDCTFLLHALLALASLHLSRIDQSLRETYMQQAGKHHDAGIAMFRNDIQNIDESNYEAVLFFAAILDPYSTAISMSATDVNHALDSILQSFALTRRLRPMVAQFYPTVLASSFTRLIPKDTQGLDWQRTESPMNTELVKLRKFSDVVEHLYPPDIVEAYKGAVHVLDLVFEHVANQRPNLPSHALVKMWVHLVKPRFLELLSERQPGALIIFAHYGVLLKRIDHYWFLEGFAEQVLHIADTFVPGEWKAWLDWPREQIYAGHEVS